MDSTNSHRYVLGKQPSLTVSHNIESWSVIVAIINAYGGAPLNDLAAAVSQHRHPGGGRAFVKYCIREGWLVEERS